MIWFLSPWWLLAIIPVLLLGALYVVSQLRGKRYAVRFTNVALLQSVAPRRPGWRRQVSAGVLLLALLMMVLAMGKPAMKAKEPLERATIVLAMDVSLSMQAKDIAPNRFEASKKAAKEFVEKLPDQYNLSLVTFSRSATVVVSPTKEHEQVLAGIDNVKLDESTAIGEAVFVSLQAIQNIPTYGASGVAPARIVLLSDGYSTNGRSPEDAAKAASDANVPVSTIAFGTQSGTVTLDDKAYAVPVDTATLRRIAVTTHGKFYQATSASELTQVYRDLGSSVGYRTRPREVTQWFTGLALLCALTAAALSLLWMSRLP